MTAPRRRWRAHAGVFLLFVALTALMTYPMAFRIESDVKNLGDPLLNSWILAWDVEQIVNGNVSGFFDANIFFPNRFTLAYSEHLFSTALLALPIRLMTENPLIPHNVLMVLSFVMCGFGAYLLAHHLTGHRAASVMAGVIYAFCPFMIGHMSHLQVIAAWGIPLTFLFLHRFVESQSAWALAGAIAACLYQMLTNLYFAVYLALFVPLFMMHAFFAVPADSRRRTLVGFAVFGLVVGIVCVPFFYPYLLVKDEMGFDRDSFTDLDASAYFAASPLNRLYGEITEVFRKPEGALFPGFAAIAMALFGIGAVLARGPDPAASDAVTGTRKTWSRVLGWALLAIAVLAVIIIYMKGIYIYWGEFRLSLTDLGRAFAVALVLVALRAYVDPGFRKRARYWGLVVLGANITDWRWRVYYRMLVLAFLLSLGPTITILSNYVAPGPTAFLIEYMPGFSGMRSTSRVAIVVMLALALFAAKGLGRELDTRNGWKKWAVGALVGVVVFVEYVSIPMPFSRVPTGDEIPQIYRWLAEREEAPSIVELPLPVGRRTCPIECPRIYFSTYHWAKLFNGYSGYEPENYNEVRDAVHAGQWRRAIGLLQRDRVEYIVIHKLMYKKDEEFRRVRAAIDADPRTKLARQVRRVYVYRILKAKN